jgi:hypothetical protein
MDRMLVVVFDSEDEAYEGSRLLRRLGLIVMGEQSLEKSGNNRSIGRPGGRSAESPKWQTL